jgi:hypothetical protein
MHAGAEKMCVAVRHRMQGSIFLINKARGYPVVDCKSRASDKVDCRALYEDVVQSMNVCVSQCAELADFHNTRKPHSVYCFSIASVFVGRLA